MNDETLKALEAAYLLMLQMPCNGLRIRNQSTFCKVRNEIARLAGVSEQDAQEEFESRAAEIASVQG